MAITPFGGLPGRWQGDDAVHIRSTAVKAPRSIPGADNPEVISRAWQALSSTADTQGRCEDLQDLLQQSVREAQAASQPAGVRAALLCKDVKTLRLTCLPLASCGCQHWLP
jgi:hypothetical protein